jgi:lipoprotein-releasing system permease protein
VIGGRRHRDGAQHRRDAGVEHLFNFQILSREVYYISELPSDLHPGEVIYVALMSLALSFEATLYPSWRAARVNPAEALRYE